MNREKSDHDAVRRGVSPNGARILSKIGWPRPDDISSADAADEVTGGDSVKDI